MTEKQKDSCVFLYRLRDLLNSDVVQILRQNRQFFGIIEELYNGSDHGHSKPYKTHFLYFDASLTELRPQYTSSSMLLTSATIGLTFRGKYTKLDSREPPPCPISKEKKVLLVVTFGKNSKRMSNCRNFVVDSYKRLRNSDLDNAESQSRSQEGTT